MNILKHKSLVIGGGILAVFAGVAIFGLIHFQGVYAKAANELKGANDRLDRLNRRNPFPADENVTIVQQNRDQLKDFLGHLQQDFRQGQVSEETMEPAQFASLLEKTSRELTNRAAAANTKLPERFAAGFGRYVAGELPAAADIPRLVVQARTIAAVCQVLFESRIGELVSVERTPFEGQGGDAATPRNIRSELAGTPDAPSTSLLTLALPPVESNELFHAERIAVSFLAREHAAWEVLNGLARQPLFAVVKHVEFTNESNPKAPVAERPGAGAVGAPVAPAVAPGQPGAVPIIYPPREERIMAGRENVRVGLVLDVYRFAGEPAKEGQP